MERTLREDPEYLEWEYRNLKRVLSDAERTHQSNADTITHYWKRYLNSIPRIEMTKLDVDRFESFKRRSETQKSIHEYDRAIKPDSDENKYMPLEFYPLYVLLSYWETLRYGVSLVDTSRDATFGNNYWDDYKDAFFKWCESKDFPHIDQKYKSPIFATDAGIDRNKRLFLLPSEALLQPLPLPSRALQPLPLPSKLKLPFGWTFDCIGGAQGKCFYVNKSQGIIMYREPKLPLGWKEHLVEEKTSDGTVQRVEYIENLGTIYEKISHEFPILPIDWSVDIETDDNGVPRNVYVSPEGVRNRAFKYIIPSRLTITDGWNWSWYDAIHLDGETKIQTSDMLGVSRFTPIQNTYGGNSIRCPTIVLCALCIILFYFIYLQIVDQKLFNMPELSSC
jgi:hypothetical protein